MGMFISGTLNTITAKWAQRTESHGRDTPNDAATTIWEALDGQDGKEPRNFDHPFFQAATMFLGEALCLVVFLIKRRCKSSSASSSSTPVLENSIYFSIPAMLDMTGTGIMNAGLCLTYASVFQMLRSAVVVFTALLSVAILKRKLLPFHWFSILCVVAGVTVVGYVSVVNSKDDGSTKSQGTVMIGNALVILAQIMVALQMVVEEKIINKYSASALKAVGFEGVFGFLALSVLFLPLFYIKIGDGSGATYPIEDAVDAMYQVSNSAPIQASLAGYVLSIAFFNFFGVSVTRAMSASHRMVLDSLRTCAVLGVSIALGWETFHYGQLLGFFLLLLGTAMYNEILTFPSIFSYSSDSATRESFVEKVRRDSEASEGAMDLDDGKTPLLRTMDV